MDNYEYGTQVSRPELYSNANISPVIILYNVNLKTIIVIKHI